MKNIVGKEKLSRSITNNLISHINTKEDRKLLDNIKEAIKIIDRKYFIPKKEYAYYDTAIPIGHRQTISQPSTVARMLMLAKLKKGDNVLELGAGSGWNASLITYLTYSGKTLSLDIVPELIENAKYNLKYLKKNLEEKNKQRLNNLEFRCSNILKKFNQWGTTYDKIIITAGIKKHQEKLIDKLAENVLKKNGRLICPYTSGPLIVIDKINGETKKRYTSEYYRFVPLLD